MRLSGVAHCSRLVSAAISCLLMFGTIPRASAAAADPTFVGVLAVAVEEDVAKQLGLTDQVKRQLNDLIQRREDEATDLVLQIRDLPQPEQVARLAPFVQESERQGFALLSEQQRQMLHGIRVARAGMVTLGEAAVAERLKLTDQQKAEVSKLLAERAAGLKGGDAQQRRTTETEYERRLAKVLTPEQRAAWESGAATPAGTAPAAGGPDARTPPAAPGTGLTETKPSGPPPSAAPSSPTVANQPAGDGKLRFQFRFTPWKDVLDWFASQAGLSLVLDVAPSGTFNYTDTRDYTPAEALDLLNSILLTKGYTLVRRERMLLVINLEDGIPPNLVSRVTVEELDKRGEFELVSCLFPLTKVTPEEIETEVAKLLGPQGSMVVLSKARQVLITETAGKLRTIRTVIQAIDGPAAGKQAPVRVFDLKTLTADEFLAIARPLLGIPGEQNETADGSLRISLDPLQARLFVSGKADQVERLEEILKLVDVPGSGHRSGSPLESPQLEVYSVDATDPATALQVLQTLLAGLPDVRLATDPVTGNLIALGRPAEHATIKATLAQLQRDVKRVEVIPLRRVDPQLAMISINKLFGGGSGDDKANKNAPIVDADSTSGQLIIRGTESQLTQIRALLEKMGEVSAAAGGADATGQGNVRVLPFTGRTAREALDQVQLLWPTMRKNQIRVVTPSAAIPLLRPGAPPASDGDAPKGKPAERTLTPKAAPQLKPAPANSPPPNKSAGTPVAPDSEVVRSTIRQDSGRPAYRQAGPATPPTDRFGPESGDFGYLSTNFATPQDAWSQTACLIAGPAVWRLATVFVAGESADDGQKPATPPRSGEPAEIVVAPGPGGIVIASEDREALDEFERLLRMVFDQRRMGPQLPTVFYLRYARADVAAELVQQVLSGESPESKAGEGGSLLGDLASTAFGQAGGGLVGSLLGLGGGGAASSRAAATSPVSITPDTRLNALIVHASPHDLSVIEELLKVIDQQASPEPVQTVGKPQRIAVHHVNVEEVANVVRQVYASRLTASVGTPQQPSPEEVIRALRGGRGGDASKSKAVQDQQKMALGVDVRSNALIVSAPEPLFQEVKTLVEELDRAGQEVDTAVDIVPIKKSNPRAVQQALTTLIGDSMRTSSTPTAQGARTSGQQRQPGTSIRQQVLQRMQSMGGVPGAASGSFVPGGSGSTGRSSFGGRTPGR